MSFTTTSSAFAPGEPIPARHACDGEDLSPALAWREGTLTGVNDDGRDGYSGPCPPTGRHRYFFKLYALDTVLRDLGRPTKAQLESAMTGHILRSTQLMGTYEQVTHAEL